MIYGDIGDAEDLRKVGSLFLHWTRKQLRGLARSNANGVTDVTIISFRYYGEISTSAEGTLSRGERDMAETAKTPPSIISNFFR